MVLDVNPDQVTLVPDGPDIITSCSGWDTVKFQDFLKEVIFAFKEMVFALRFCRGKNRNH